MSERDDIVGFKRWARKQEYLLRGTYMGVAADLEWIMMSIITKIFKDVDSDKFKAVVKISGIKKYRGRHRLTLDQKVKIATESLRMYEPEFFGQHENDLKKIYKLRDLRNRFAHG